MMSRDSKIIYKGTPMSLPANLFVDTPEMEDVSLQRLSTNVEEWPEEIISKVRERLPHSQTMNPMVQFKKKDDENGTATGSVIINTADKVVVAPLIVKDFMLYPLDVMIAGGKLLPLTPDYFAAVMDKSQLFDKIDEYPTFGGLGRFEDANLWNAIYPPSLGRYAYATAGYEICEELYKSFDGTELKAFLLAKGNEKTAARLLSGPHKELVKKLAHLQPVNMNEYRQGVENLIPRNIAMLRHEGPNKYTVLQNSDSVFHPSVVTMSRHECQQLLSTMSDHVEDDINEVDQNGEKFLRLPQGNPDGIRGFQTDREVPESVDEFDHYSVKTKSGVAVEGIGIPRVIDFHMKPVNVKMFIGKTMSTIQDQIFGVRVKASRFKMPFCAPRVGQTGTFVFMPDESHGLATQPVTIESITDDMGALKLKAIDLLGEPLELRMTETELHAIVPLGKRSFQIPKAMRWVPMEGFYEVTNSADDYAVKSAGERTSTWPVVLAPTGHGFYAMSGVAKYAAAMNWDPTFLQPYQVKFILASLGCGQEKMAAAFKEAAFKSRAVLHWLNPVPTSAEKIAKARPLAEQVVKIARKFRANLWKEASLLSGFSDKAYHLADGETKQASLLESSQTVDALLSLNFVSPENIARYVGKLPALKSTVSHLASCLLASRLGMREIPEQAAVSAMMRLVEVVDGLERLRATQEMASQKGV